MDDRMLCRVCGERIATYIPREGDGSLSLILPHGPLYARCPGSKHEGIWVADGGEPQ